MGKTIVSSLLWVAALTGCSQAQYQGVSPSMRNVGPPADSRTSYVGMNFNFAVDKPSSYHAAAHDDFATTSATASVE